MPLSANISSLIPVIGTIVSIRPQSGNCSNQMIFLTTDNGPVNFILSSDTVVIDSTRLRAGMRVAAYYDGNRPTPLIFPPQYSAVLMAVLRPGEQILLGHFDRNLTSQDPDQPLRLNIAPHYFRPYFKRSEQYLPAGRARSAGVFQQYYSQHAASDHTTKSGGAVVSHLPYQQTYETPIS